MISSKLLQGGADVRAPILPLQIMCFGGREFGVRELLLSQGRVTRQPASVSQTVEQRPASPPQMTMQCREPPASGRETVVGPDVIDP